MRRPIASATLISTMDPSHDLRRLEELGLNSSAPPGQLLYDGWLVRLQPGQAKRARSVNAVYPSSHPVPDKVAYCEKLYASHGLPAIFRITPFSQPATLDAELERLGYPQFDLTAVEAATIDPAQLLRCGAQAMALPEWVQTVGDLRASPPHYRQSHLERLQAVKLPLRAVALQHDGAIVAAGLTIVEDGWAGLFDIVTASTARRRGYGERVVQSLLKAACELGALNAYLQVGADNAPARALYARYGFKQRYQYWYRGHPD